MALASPVSWSGLGRSLTLFAAEVRCGVTMITNSVSFRCQSVERNSAPRIGTFAAPGIWLMVLE